MEMIILCTYVFVGLLSGCAVLAWQYFYSSSGEIRGDDLFVALLFVGFWIFILIGFAIHLIGKLFTHDRVIARRKK